MLKNIKGRDSARPLKYYSQFYFNRLGASCAMKIDHEKMTAEIDLMSNKTMYVVKDGQLILHEIPDYGETVIITMGGKVDRLETTQKRKI